MTTPHTHKPRYLAAVHERNGHRFEIDHDTLRHPPYGLFIVKRDGEEIGRQLSHPSLADCQAMLRPPSTRAIKRRRFTLKGTPGRKS